jgi:superfamily II DNA or RNA helicase
MAGAKSSGHRQVKVSMVETAFNRLKKDPQYFGKVGLLIVDEAHYGEFKKIYEYFPNALIIGVTATPVLFYQKRPYEELF